MTQKSMDKNGLLINQRNCTVKKAFEGSHVTSVSGRRNARAGLIRECTTRHP